MFTYKDNVNKSRTVEPAESDTRRIGKVKAYKFENNRFKIRLHGTKMNFLKLVSL